MEEQNQGKEPFVGQQDRPDVKLNPDDPITNLRVRDLAALLGGGAKSLILENYGNKGHLKDILDLPPKHYIKEANDAKLLKDVKDYGDTYVVGGGSGPDPTLRQTVDALVREVAQLREEVKQLRR